MQITITSEILLAAYSQGLFPMADSANSEYVHWYCPKLRGQLSIDDMHIPRRLKKNLRQMKISSKPYEIHINSNFEHVIKYCANETLNRKDTWINQKIIDAYCTLNKDGHAHSVECYQNGEIVGGLYGVAIGGAFFGESMFSTARDASKVALVHLVARLHHAGFEILDTQFTNEHLEQFGVYELPYKKYIEKLETTTHLNRKFGFTNLTELQLIQNYLSQGQNEV